MEFLKSCPSCGAARTDDAERCALCGTSLRAPGDDDVVCPGCGRANPAGARFCNHCGVGLSEEAEASRSGEATATAGQSGIDPVDGVQDDGSMRDDNTRPSSKVGRRALVIIGVAIAIIIGLYLLSSWLSGRPDQTLQEDEGQTVGTEMQVPPLSDTLQQAADIYAAENTAEGWFEAGRYYLTQSWETQQSDPVSSVLWAQKAIELFERSLEMEDDPDVRLAVAEAASLERSDPMRPVQEIQAILEAHPEHVGANLMLGERRVMIGRYAEAIEAFETVLDVASEGDPRRVAAEQFLTEARRRMAETGRSE